MPSPFSISGVPASPANGPAYIAAELAEDLPQRPVDATEVVEDVEEVVEHVKLVDERNWLVRIFSFLGWVEEWLFGVAALILGLSILATLPILQFLSLGYLLEVAGRIGRKRKFTAGFVGVRPAARVGSIIAGTWLWILPLRFAASLANSAKLIDPASPAARGWSFALVMFTIVVGWHLLSAYWRGGRLRHFFWPANPVRMAREWFNVDSYPKARDAVWGFLVRLRLPYYFWLGCRGFAGTLMWLVLPITLLGFSRSLGPVGALTGLFGAGMLMVVLMYLPFLQAHFAAENRFGALFEVATVHRLFRRAPVAFWFAMIFTLLLALPLYLFKIEIVPREAAWLPSLLFVVSIFPTRLLSGWAYSRAVRRNAPRSFLVRWPVWWLMPPVTAFYVFIVFFTQYTSWHGVWSLYEQHAFLLPVPFLGM